MGSVYVRIEVDLDVGEESLAAWVRESFTVNPCVDPSVSQDELEMLDNYYGEVRVDMLPSSEEF